MVSEAVEMPWLWAGLLAYALATFIAMWTVVPRHAHVPSGAVQSGTYIPRLERVVLLCLVAGVLLLTMALAQRWMRLGHGPFVNLFELLNSQLWSLGLFFAIVYWRVPKVRTSAVVVLPLMWVLGTWVLMLEPEASHYPQTYYNNWKWAHVGLGKVFLASLLVASGFAGIMLMRHIPKLVPLFSRAPADDVLDKLAWRFIMLALIFDSLMLVAGAVWAQDAWGRYWAWDELETSSFLNWLGIGAAIHLRMTYKFPTWVSSTMILGLFVFAFITYFGAPYISPTAHKGVI
jgi:ABC-type transport system involved in cytochrome c biogenesis permease subunit